MTAREAAIEAIRDGRIVSNLVHEEIDGHRLHVIFKHDGTEYGYISHPHNDAAGAERAWARMQSEARRVK